MNFKPNEFFLGLVEFITILLPGAALMTILLAVEAKHPLGMEHAAYTYAFSKDNNFVFWVSFVFISFGLGYFLSSFASGLDELYDRVRIQIYPYEEHIEKIFKGKEKAVKAVEAVKDVKDVEAVKAVKAFEEQYTGNLFRKCLHFLFEFETEVKIDKSFDEANKLFLTQHESVQFSSNTYKWASTLLETYYPNISEQANRIMAASKFFRSMVIVAAVLFVLQLLDYISLPKWISILLLILSFREYIVQRQKSTQMVYRSIVTLFYAPDKLKGEK